MGQQIPSLGEVSQDSVSSRFSRFSAFFPFYLTEHKNVICRRLHFFGSLAVLVSLLKFAFSGDIGWILMALACGYGFAWLGHFVFEKNRPFSFKQPLYSFIGDWKLFWMMLTGKLPF